MHYKIINIPNYEQVLAELQAFVLGNMPTPRVFLHKGDHEKMIHECPLIATWLAEHDLEIRRMAIICARPGVGDHLGGVHVDYCNDDIVMALNFGISNYENTYTGVYEELPGNKLLDSVLPNGIHYYRYERHDVAAFKEVDRFNLTKPVLFYVNKPHCPVNTTNEDRISLSLRFTRNPVELYN